MGLISIRIEETLHFVPQKACGTSFRVTKFSKINPLYRHSLKQVVNPEIARNWYTIYRAHQATLVLHRYGKYGPGHLLGLCM
jgi:hypothetical protein